MKNMNTDKLQLTGKISFEFDFSSRSLLKYDPKALFLEQYLKFPNN